MQPKVFISYSWTSLGHQSVVQQWAEQLVADGIDVVLDIYDLKEGDDKFVYMERMKANLESTRGLVFSGQLLLDLVEHGVAREDAYRMVQRHAMRAWKEGLSFRELVLKDQEITRRVSRQQVERAFDLKRQLRNIDKIFARVFGSTASKLSRPAKKAAHD